MVLFSKIRLGLYTLIAPEIPALVISLQDFTRRPVSISRPAVSVFGSPSTMELPRGKSFVRKVLSTALSSDASYFPRRKPGQLSCVELLS